MAACRLPPTWATACLPATEIEHTRRWWLPGYYAAMGYGVPAGLGLQAATGQRPLVLVGDGAFQMTGVGNSATARRLQLGPDRAAVQQCQLGDAAHLPARVPSFNDLGEWGYAAMAAGMGGDGVRCLPAPKAEGGAGAGDWRRAAASS
jgi:indolepyruvate decarboxylase